MTLWPITLTWYCTSGLSLFVVLLLHKKAIAFRNTITFVSSLCIIIGACIAGSSIGIYSSFAITLAFSLCITLLFVYTKYLFTWFPLEISKRLAQYEKRIRYLFLLLLFSVFSGATHTYKITTMHHYLKDIRSGVIAEVVDISPWSKKGGRIITMQLQAHKQNALWGIIKWYHKGTTQLKAGDTVLIDKYSYKEPSKEFLIYQYKEGIITYLFDRPYPKILVINRPAFSFHRFFNDWRDDVYIKAKKILSPRTFAFFAALFLGHKEYPEYEAIKERFSRWGISHFLARSGIHIAILISIWSMVFRVLPIGWHLQQLLLVLLLCFYSLMSWPSLSFYRALFLFLLNLIGILLRRIPHPLYLLSILTCATVLHNPYVAGFLDFQLSFGVTFLLLTLSFQRKKRTIARN